MRDNITLGELDLPPINGRPENYWRLNDLRPGVAPLSARRFLLAPAPDLSDCLARTLPGRPWLLQLWEPLHTKAPSPARCQPYCCYSRTVIFYHRPYITHGGKPWNCDGRWHWLEPGGGFEKYDEIHTRLGWDDLIAFEGTEFEVNGGQVQWHHSRWWMHRAARRRTGRLG